MTKAAKLVKGGLLFFCEYTCTVFECRYNKAWERISLCFCFVLRKKDKSVKSVWRLAGGGGVGGRGD